jgi:hypothetical protein
MRPEETDVPYVGIDFDNTLVDKVWPDSGIGEPIYHNFRKLDQVIAEGWTPIVFTARSWSDYDAIRVFMAGMGYPGIRVICGKPLFIKYIGDEAVNETELSWLP